MIQRYPQYWFFRKGPGNNFPPHFGYDSFRKMFLLLYSVNRPNLSDCLYFLIYWVICVLHLFVPQVETPQFLKCLCFFFETLCFLSSRLSTWPEIQDKHLYLEKGFQGEIKNIFINFKGFLVAKNCFRSERMPRTLKYIYTLVKVFFVLME